MREVRVLELAAAANAAQAALVAELVSFAASGDWQGAGIRSFGHWCDINLGHGSRPTSRLVTAARRLAELPAIRSAFTDGSLSPDKAVLVAEVATSATDERFASVARQASLSQLQRICAAYRRLTDDDSPDELERRRDRRHVSITPTDDGLVRLVAVLEPDEAAIVAAALDARVEAAWRAHRPADDVAPAPAPAPDLAARRADALVELATEGLVAGPDPVVRGERIEVRVLVDAAVLAGDRPDGVCAIDGIGAVPLATVARLLCDCRHREGVVLPDGSLDLGRTQRTVTRRQRRALRHRDRGCRYPGCRNQRFVDAHHVIPWERGGRTDLDNLLSLCPTHHRLFHEGGYTIDVLGDGQFSFRRPDGRTLDPPPLRCRPDAPPPPAPGVPRAQGGGERFDLALTIDALVGVAS